MALKAIPDADNQQGQAAAETTQEGLSCGAQPEPDGRGWDLSKAHHLPSGLSDTETEDPLLSEACSQGN